MNSKNTTYNIILIAMFATVLAVMSQLSIPLPIGVPVTLQTFAVAFIGVVLGYKRGLAAYFVWLFLGVVGLPVFAQLHSGVGTVLGMTGGFIIGFFFLVLLSGLFQKKSYALRIPAMLLGLILTHILGILQFAFLMHFTLQKTFLLVSLPYILKDIISVVVALYVGDVLKKRLSKANLEFANNTEQ